MHFSRCTLVDFLDFPFTETNILVTAFRNTDFRIVISTSIGFRLVTPCELLGNESDEERVKVRH